MARVPQVSESQDPEVAALIERIKARRSQSADGRRDAIPTAIERLERRQARLAAAAARLNETLLAAKPLYAALSPEQHKIADEVLAPQRRGMRHGHRRGHAGGVPDGGAAARPQGSGREPRLSGHRVSVT